MSEHPNHGRKPILSVCEFEISYIYIYIYYREVSTLREDPGGDVQTVSGEHRAGWEHC